MTPEEALKELNIEADEVITASLEGISDEQLEKELVRRANLKRLIQYDKEKTVYKSDHRIFMHIDGNTYMVINGGWDFTWDKVNNKMIFYRPGEGEVSIEMGEVSVISGLNRDNWKSLYSPIQSMYPSIDAPVDCAEFDDNIPF